MQRMCAAAVWLALAACSPATPEQDASGPAAPAEVEGSPVSTPSAEVASGPSPPPGAALPPADADRRYAGRWATRADLCEGGAWVFARDRLGLEDGPICEFREAAEIPGGYRIAARCEARGAVTDEDFTLRFAESARAMLVEGLSVLPDTGLVYCGPG